MEPEIRVLTVRPPWSWVIAHGGKTVENRSWPTTYRGLLAIHGGARSRWDPDGQASPLVRAAWAERARSRPDAHNSICVLKKTTDWMTFGAVIAVAELRHCCWPPNCPSGCSPWAVVGQYHWQLANIRPLAEPVPCRGMLGLWRLPEDAEKAVRAQLGGVACHDPECDELCGAHKDVTGPLVDYEVLSEDGEHG